MAQYKDFLFYDKDTGEDFAVEVKITTQTDEEAKQEAINTALEWFADPRLIEEVDAEVVEMMGIDTY